MRPAIDKPRDAAPARASPLLLREFLRSLEPLGVRALPRDHFRLRLLLETRSDWSRAQLRDAVATLLASSPEQLDAIRRRFDGFFGLPAEEGEYARLLNLEHTLGRLAEEVAKPGAAGPPKKPG